MFRMTRHPGQTTEPNLCLRPARPADLAPYLGLLDDADQWLASRNLTRWGSGSVRDFAPYFAESIEAGEVYLAYLDDDLAGTLRLLPKDSIAWPEIEKNDAFYVYNLVVRRTWAGQRLGRRILDWAECRTASMSRNFLRLDCFAGNSILRRYYADAGFQDRGAIDAEYPPPIGVLRLQRFEKRVRPSD